MKKNVITLLLLAISVLPVASCGNNKASGEDENGNLVKVGQQVPSFSLNYLNGSVLSVENLKGKVVLLNFWASWCPYCVAELKVVPQGIIERYALHEDFVFVAMNRGEEPQKIEEFLQRSGYKENDTFYNSIAMDRDSSVFKLFANKGIPRNYVIDRRGKLAYLGLDYTEEEFKKLQDAIDKVLNDKVLDNN